MSLKSIFFDNPNTKYVAFKDLWEKGHKACMVKNLFSMNEVSLLHDYAHKVATITEGGDVKYKTRIVQDYGDVIESRLEKLSIDGMKFTTDGPKHHFIFLDRGWGVVGNTDELMELMGDWTLIVVLNSGSSKLEIGGVGVCPKKTTGILIPKGLEVDFGVDVDVSRDYIMINLKLN